MLLYERIQSMRRSTRDKLKRDVELSQSVLCPEERLSSSKEGMLYQSLPLLRAKPNKFL
jgi:hypothetical protein